MDDHIINLYDTDFLIWVERQVKLLRGRHFDQLDLDHLTDEIADMGGQIKRELRHRLELLLMHLLKYRYQPQRISGSWRGTIREQRSRLQDLLDDAPSLASQIDLAIGKCYAVARARAADETGLAPEIFPDENPFNLEQLLNPGYWPPSDTASADSIPAT